jgi:hypothetical protein
MAAISVSIQRGNDGFHISDFTVAANAPATGDAEFRFNTADANSVNLTRKDLNQMLEAFTRWVNSGPIFTTTPVL